MRSIALILLALLPIEAAFADITEAKVTGGAVSGTTDRGITIFTGIPCASLQVGDLRWKAPAPMKPRTDVTIGDTCANGCMQPPRSQGNIAHVSGDCLYLVVWMPAKSVRDK